MPPPFPGASAGVLRALADAFRTGRVGAGASRLALSRVCECPEDAAVDIARLLAEGLAPAHLALLLDARADAVDGGPSGAQKLELVWTGPENAVSYSRDTSVVVRELFESARERVLVSTFVIRQAATVFEPLAARMDARHELSVRLFVHVGRDWRDTRHESELLREFADSLRRDWPGTRLPEVYYDPRSLAPDGDHRATWHAKCVLVDEEVAFVTSANFTEWAQERNVEAGVLVRDREFTAQLRAQFDGLVQGRQVARLPGF
jgi:phosphatidylserine/phosphatidylglycerophosphate/cardiolipin synthase-like enzyme